MPDAKTMYDQAVAEAHAKADAWMKDDALARAKGATPEQVAARQRVVALFCEFHWKDQPADQRAPRLANIDYTEPIMPVNGQTTDTANPKATGFLGMGRKPAFLVSEKFPPKKPEDPVYCLQYFPLKGKEPPR